MPNYKDINNNVHFLESEKFESFLPVECVPITDEEADALRPAPAVIQPIISVSPWQIRKALNATGLRSAVESAVAAGDTTVQDAWHYATEFRRDNPLVNQLGAALGKTEADLDNLFELAQTL